MRKHSPHLVGESELVLDSDRAMMDGHSVTLWVDCNLACYSDSSLLPFYTHLALALVGSAALVPVG